MTILVSLFIHFEIFLTHEDKMDTELDNFTQYIRIPAITFQMSRHKFSENPLENILSLSAVGVSRILILNTGCNGYRLIVASALIIITKMGKE